MADLSDLLARSLVAPPPGRLAGRDLIAYVGGRTALTRALSGLPAAPKRGDYGSQEAYDADRLRWRTAARRAQRADDEGRAGKQRRGVTGKGRGYTPEQSARLQAFGTLRRYASFRRSGMNARMIAVIVVDSPTARQYRAQPRERRMPSGGPPVWIQAPAAREVLERIRSHGIDSGAGMFREKFFDAYGLPDEADIDDVIALKLWPRPDAEPDDWTI